jgi:flagellar biosynthesis chaperone FliJ
MAQFTYRLQLLLERKEEAKKEAERELTRREQELESQVERLKGLQRREQELIAQRGRLRRDLLCKPSNGGELTAHDVVTRSEYVKVVGLQIEEARSDIVTQQQVVEEYENKVREAKLRVDEARREVEVLTKHRAKQEERFLRDLEAKEELALDEIGNVLFTTRRRSE